MISVIIPVYNVEKYLYVCLNSVLKQTYTNFEIICIDDASTDTSLEILEYFAKKDQRIKILKNESNKGPGFSRNKGLNIATGEYISFLDGDDWFTPNIFEILIEKAKKHNPELIIFKNVVYYEESKEFGMEKYYDMEFMDKFEDTIFNHWDLDKTEIFKMANAPWNKLYLKSFLDENDICFPDEHLIHEDNPFFYKVITQAKRVLFINKYLHTRRRRPGSIMSLNNERLFDNIPIMNKIFDIFFEDIKLYNYYKKELLTYIFTTVFIFKYKQIKKELKKEFFEKIQNTFKVYLKKYGLENDIKECVDIETLKFFKVEYIITDNKKL